MRITSLANISVCALLLGSGLCHAQNDALKLWYRQPAGAWTQALPVGNGRLAAMVFGTIPKEHIQLNEDTVWSGEKRDRSNLEAPKTLAEIRRLLVEGHPAQAQALADKTMISIPRALPVYETLAISGWTSAVGRMPPITGASWIWTPASSPCGTPSAECIMCARFLRPLRPAIA
jgi:alpha-L-fucosidase 2